jgi:O-antigen/teichoic acid export membrane protein
VSEARGRVNADLSKVARGGTLNFIGALSNAVLGFLLILIITRGVGAQTSGVFFESVALLSLLSTIAEWGAETGLVRSIPRFRVLGQTEDVRHAIRAGFVPVVIAGAVLGLVMFVFAEPLGTLLSNGAEGADLEPVVRALAPFLPIQALFTVALAATRGFGTMKPTVTIDKVGRASAQVVIALIVVVLGLSSVALALAWAVPVALGLAAALAWTASLLHSWEAKPATGTSQGPRRTFLEFWRFTLPRGLAGVFAVAILWLDTLLIGSLRSPAEAGIYVAATRYLVFGQFVGVAIIQVVGPKLSELLTRGDRRGATEVYRSSTAWLMLASWPIYISMVVMAPGLLALFGQRYQQASTALVILGAGMLVATAVGPIDMVLLMAGKSRWNLANTVVALGLNVGLNLLLIPRWGITGAAIAWSASILANNLLPMTQVWLSLRMHPFATGWVVAALITWASVGLTEWVARLLVGPTLVALIVSGLIGVAVQAALMWRLRGPLHLLAFRDAFRRRERGGEAPDLVVNVAAGTGDA